MPDDNTSRTLAVILGARAFPYAPKLAGSRAFLNSAIDMEEYFTDEDGLGLPPRNILSLFDDSHSPSDQLIEVAKFIDLKKQELKNQGSCAQEIFIYYVGHGLFTRADAAYCLAIRCTNEIDEGATSIRASELAGIISRNAAFMRRYLILDCCFAASIHKEFQSGALGAARKQIEQDLPPKLGTALLCSSSARDVSLAPEGSSHTMFSSALLQALRHGHEMYGPRFSISQLGDLVNEFLRAAYPDSYVRPEVHSPDQRDGDIARSPIFPNPAFHESEDRRLPPANRRTPQTEDTEPSLKAEQQEERSSAARPSLHPMPSDSEYHAKSGHPLTRNAYQEDRFKAATTIQERNRTLTWTSIALAVCVLLGISYWIGHKSAAVSTVGDQRTTTTQPKGSDNRAPSPVGSGSDASKSSTGNPITSSQVTTADNNVPQRVGGNRDTNNKKGGVAPSQPQIAQPPSVESAGKGTMKATSGEEALAQQLLPQKVPYRPNGTWKVLRTGTSKWLMSIAFATPQLGSAVGWYGAMVHTEDGGESWTEQQSRLNESLSCVTFATSTVGFAVGRNGIILRTDDAGRTWSRQNTGTSEHLGSVVFVSSESGFVVGGPGIILHTTDGGHTWSKQNSGTDVGLSSVTFVTRSSGWVVGNDGTVLHTEDAGATWVNQNTGVGELLHSVSFANAESGWIVGQNGVILHTDDGGRSWRKQDWGNTKELHSVAFATPRSGFAVGEDGIIIHTEDSGKTWTKQESNTGVELFGSLMTPQARWATARDGILLRWR
jgi:photosystem II stability/assembly factor-like uncharacterized protein